jgi:hypothetical protein
MARIYARQLDLPGVTVGDWELLARLEKLFDPYRPIVSDRGGYEMFSANDSRGEYTAVTVDALRAQALEQDEPPGTIRIFVAGKTDYGKEYELGVELREGNSSALLRSEAEEIVDHVAVQLRHLLTHDRRYGASTEPAVEPAVVPPPPTPSAKEPPWRWWQLVLRVVNHQWFIQVVGGLIVLLVGAYLTARLAGWIGGGDNTTPTTATAAISGTGGTPPPGGKTYFETETPNHPVKTFQNHKFAFNEGPKIVAGQKVRVSCKVFDPTLESVRPDGYWYLIASPPWSNKYFAPANTFLNGDPAHGPFSHNVDEGVPDCLP